VGREKGPTVIRKRSLQMIQQRQGQEDRRKIRRGWRCGSLEKRVFEEKGEIL
jgi:hypothetical protein